MEHLRGYSEAQRWILAFKNSGVWRMLEAKRKQLRSNQNREVVSDSASEIAAGQTDEQETGQHNRRDFLKLFGVSTAVVATASVSAGLEHQPVKATDFSKQELDKLKKEFAKLRKAYNKLDRRAQWITLIALALAFYIGLDLIIGLLGVSLQALPSKWLALLPLGAFSL